MCVHLPLWHAIGSQEELVDPLAARLLLQYCYMRLCSLPPRGSSGHRFLAFFLSLISPRYSWTLCCFICFGLIKRVSCFMWFLKKKIYPIAVYFCDLYMLCLVHLFRLPGRFWLCNYGLVFKICLCGRAFGVSLGPPWQVVFSETLLLCIGKKKSEFSSNKGPLMGFPLTCLQARTESLYIFKGLRQSFVREISKWLLQLVISYWPAWSQDLPLHEFVRLCFSLRHFPSATLRKNDVDYITGPWDT